MKTTAPSVTLVKADRAKCQSFANCVVASPDVFDLDDNGLVTVLREQVNGERLKEVLDAVNSCPVAALWVEEA